jgi:hypothetical protein
MVSGLVSEACTHGTLPLLSIDDRKFFDQLNKYQLQKNGSAL